MKKNYSILFFLFLSLTISARYVVDTIVAVVYGEDVDDIAIITRSDISRPGIDGMIHTLDEKVFEKLLWFDGRKHRILPTDEDIERHLKMVERENNMGRKDLIEVFSRGGYTLEEGKAQFGIMYTVNAMIDFKVRGGLFVSRVEVVDYYNNNPEYVDASFVLKRGIVPYDYKTTPEQQLNSIHQALKESSKVPSVVWSPVFSIKQDQIASDKHFILGMEKGGISDPVLTADGIEVYMVVDLQPRRLRTLDERYAQISELLKRPKYQELLTNYKKHLFDNASIVYF